MTVLALLTIIASHDVTTAAHRPSVVVVPPPTVMGVEGGGGEGEGGREKIWEGERGRKGF